MKITDVRMLCLSRIHEPENQWIVGGIRAIKADGAIVIIDNDEGCGVSDVSRYCVMPAFVAGRAATSAIEIAAETPTASGNALKHVQEQVRASSLNRP